MKLLNKLLELLPASASGATAPQIGAAPANRLSTRRPQRMRGGYVSWPSLPGLAPCECQIKDVSAQGARVHMPDAPTDNALWAAGASLYFVSEGHEVPCKIAWRDGAMIGLNFVGRPQPPTRVYG